MENTRKHYALIYGLDVISIFGARHEIQGRSIWFYDADDQLVAGLVCFELSTLKRIECYSGTVGTPDETREIIWQREELIECR